MAGKMSLGGCTFETDPTSMTPIQEMKPVARVATYSGSAIFQWEKLYQGVKITLSWNWMSEGQYLTLRPMYYSDETVVFDPQIGEGTFNVVVLDLTGKYFRRKNKSPDGRLDVVMVLEIRSQASASAGNEAFGPES